MPISTPRDNNRVPTMIATSNVDGQAVVSLVVNSANNRLKVQDGATGSSFSSANAERDDNRVPAMWGVSSSDGVTPVAIYCTASGALLIDST